DLPELRARLGTAARASVVEKFSWTAAAEAHRAFFRAALATAAPGQPDYAQIERLARQALTENPDGVEALALLAQALLQRRSFTEAARVCLRLLALDEAHLNALATLAKCLFHANEPAAARATLERILELDPGNALARENLAALAQLPADANGVQPPAAAAASPEAKPAADGGVGAPLPAELQPEMDAVSAAYQAGDLPAAHAMLHRLFKAHPDCDALRELAGESTALIRAACPVPDFGGAVKPARLNIALMTFNALAYTKLCLASLRAHTTEPYNIFIVDNGSTDGTREWLAAQTDENLFVEFSPANLGVPGGRNRLLQLIQPHLREDGFVIFMDNDIEVMPGWVEHFSNFFAAHPHVGIGTAVGHQFVVRGDVRELGAVPVGVPAPVDVACGGFVCWVRSATARAVGDYDERLGLFWHEDDDYSVRALAEGWEVFIVPGAPVLHHEHKSGAAKPGLKVGGSPANQRYLVNKWRAMGVVNANGRIRRPVPQRPLTNAPMRKSRARVSLPVRWAAPFFNPTGYASEAINFVLPLSHQLNLSILHDNQITSEKFVAELPTSDHDRLMALHDKVFLMRGGIFVTHNPGHGFKRVADALYHVGRTMFETDRIPTDWAGCCNAMDEVWVPSQFNVETFANSGVERDKLVVIPGAVDEGLFAPAKHTPLALPNPARFNFVSVFEWSGRKAWDVLLAAYLREFSAEDDVCLHLRTYLFGHPDADPRDTLEPLIREFAAKLGLGRKPLPRIELLTEQIPTRDLPRLYLAADCVVVPSRGEGWGRPMHEAMAMGRPVIATGWSANLEFMNAENSYLLDYELAEVKGVEPYLKHYLGHRWANPSEKHLRELMRRVRENPAEAQAKGALAREHVTTHFSRAAVAEKVIRRLEAIERKFTTPACPAVLCRQFETATDMNEARPTAVGCRPHGVSVAWDGSFLDYGSLSHVNRELTGALEKLPGMRVTRLGQSALNAPAGLHEVAHSLKAAAPAGTQVTVRHAWPPVWDAPRAGKWVQIQPWEFGALPVEWAKHAARADEIWCYSNYVRRVYLAAGLDPAKVRVVPLGIDPGRFRPEARPLPLATRRRFKFLFVGGTITRKGPDVLLRAYLEAFTAADDVCLVIKDFGGNGVYQGQTFSAQIKAAQAQPNAPEIIHLTDELSPETLPGLYTACDCLVHPYRGEGFGLPVLEAMACGLPVVVTGGGATDDFATDEFAFRLPATRRPIGNQVGELELVSRGWLLEPDAHALREQLRAIAREPAEARAKGRAASAHVRAHWTWRRAA
ncbi:MAG: wbdA, partial [Limisphaerales bacterium]